MTVAITVENIMTPEQENKQRELEQQAREIAQALDRGLNPHAVPGQNQGTGFCLLIFEFGDPPQPATWISNANRGDMIKAVEEWLAHAKQRA
jgi:GH24 family phage-related lysozyme (muramidase)